MSQVSEEKLIRVTARVLAKNKGLDDIIMAAKIVDRIKEEMEDAEGGYGIPPVQISRNTVGDVDSDLADPDIQRIWDRGKAARNASQIQPKPQDDPAPLHPPRDKRMVIMPDDPEFKEAKNFSEAERRGVSTGLRLSRVSAPSGGPAAPPVKYWNEEQIIRGIQDNLPTEITFTPTGSPATVKVQAVRDFEALIGLDQVRLKYYNPGISGEGGVDMGTEGAALVIDMIGRYTFNLTDRELNWDKAMASIYEQLESKFAGKISTNGGRRVTLGTVDPGQSPMEYWKDSNPGMREEDTIRRESNWGGVDNPQGDVLANVIESNRKLGNR